MRFEKHLFISYAHDDNLPLGGQALGWITRFHNDLEDRLKIFLPEPPRIWRDKRLAGNDVFSREIVEQLPKTALLISIVSPRYLRSVWCKREVEEFCAAAEQSGGLTLGNKTRVVKVLKLPVDRNELPSALHESLGYEFFKYDGLKVPIELDSAYGPELVPLFNRQLNKLACELAELLQGITAPTSSVSAAIPAAGPPKPVVYLAECGYDSGEMRDMLESELRVNGYTVLPDRQLPAKEADYVREVTALMQRSQLSVHLFGSDYGMVPYGPSGKAAPVLQNELAIERSRAAGMPRIIWLPAGTASANPVQQAFLERLQNDADAQFGADLIDADIETVKSAIHAVLKKLQEPKPAPAAQCAGADDLKLAYIICDATDKPALRMIRTFLTGAGYQVRLSPSVGEPAEVRQQHLDLLAECDLLVLFYGNGDERWRGAVEADLFKLKAYRPGKPLPKRCTLIAQPVTADKQDMLDFMEPGFLDATAAFPEAALAALLGK